jgi:hypothetical protein
MDIPRDLINSTEARAILGISAHTMAKLLRNRKLVVYQDPLDERKKLVSRAEVLSLKTPRAEAA